MGEMMDAARLLVMAEDERREMNRQWGPLAMVTTARHAQRERAAAGLSARCGEGGAAHVLARMLTAGFVTEEQIREFAR